MIGRARGIAVAGALALSAAMTSCFGHLPPCPAAGGPAWTELQSAHFRLRTDAAPDDARRVVADLEQFQIATLFIVGAPIDLDTGRVPAVLLDHGWTDSMPRQIAGYFTHALFQPPRICSSSSAELQGLTQKDAAEMVGTSLSGMKSRVQRGREKIREMFEECCEISVDCRGRVVDCEARDLAEIPEDCRGAAVSWAARHPAK